MCYNDGNLEELLDSSTNFRRETRGQHTFFVWGGLLFDSMLIELCKFKCQKWKGEKIWGWLLKK